MSATRGGRVEGVLVAMCDVRGFPGDMWFAAARLFALGKDSGEPLFRGVQLRLWRSFYARNPQRMLEARRADVAAKARAFEAFDRAKEAMDAVNKALGETFSTPGA